MNRNFLLIGLLAAIGLTLSAVGTVRADGGATIITAAACGVNDADSVIWVITDVGMTSVTTPSGNVKVSCQGTLPDGAALPDHGAVHLSGFTCNTPAGLTDDSVETISPSGQVNLQCTIHH